MIEDSHNVWFVNRRNRTAITLQGHESQGRRLVICRCRLSLRNTNLLIGSKRSRRDDPEDESTRASRAVCAPEPQTLTPDTSEIPYLEGESSTTTRERQVSSPMDDQDESMRRISDLSFILHPSHDTSSPEKERISSIRPLSNDMQTSAALDTACSMLNLSQGALNHLWVLIVCLYYFC